MCLRLADGSARRQCDSRNGPTRHLHGLTLSLQREILEKF